MGFYHEKLNAIIFSLAIIIGSLWSEGSQKILLSLLHEVDQLLSEL